MLMEVRYMLKGKKKLLVLLLLLPIIAVGVLLQQKKEETSTDVKIEEKKLEETVKQEEPKKAEVKQEEPKKEEEKKEELKTEEFSKQVENEKEENKSQTAPVTQKVSEPVKQVETKKETVTKPKEKSCKIVTVPAVYKTVTIPAKIRKEPINKTTYGQCAIMPDGSEVRVDGWSSEKRIKFMDDNRIGRIATCEKGTTVTTGYIDIIEQPERTEEVLVTPETTKEVCE